MGTAKERTFEAHKKRELQNIAANSSGGVKWLKARYDEARAMKSHASGDEWLMWHAVQCAVMDEMTTLEKRRASREGRDRCC